MGTHTLLLDRSSAFLNYTARGQTLAIWGSQTYARLYQYDILGRMSELRTYQDLAYGVQPTVASNCRLTPTIPPLGICGAGAGSIYWPRF